MTDEARLAVLENRMDKVEARQDDLDGIVKSIAVLSTKQASTDEDVKEIKGDVKSIGATLQEMRERPGKRWDSMGYKIVEAIVLGVVAYVMVRLGLAT